MEAAARLLSFAFYLVAARVLAPAGFGELRYTIALVLLFCGPIQVLCLALTTELGARRGHPEQVREVLSASVTAAAGLWAAILVVAAVVSLAGAAGTADPLGFAVVFAGTVTFQTYYSASRGLGQLQRAAAAYVGASLVQIIVFAGFALLADPSPRLALVVYGMSSALPVVACELRAPILAWPSGLRRGRAALRTLWMVALPLVAWQIAYLVWNSADQIWVASRFDATSLGLYSAAKNLSQMLVIIPAAITGVMLPSIAGRRVRGDLGGALRLTILVAGSAAAVSLGVLTVVAVLRRPVLQALYGHAYVGASGALVGLAASMTVYSVFAAAASAAIGWRRSRHAAGGMALAAVLLVVGLPVLGSGATATAWVTAASIAGGLLTMFGSALVDIGGPRRALAIIRNGGSTA